MYEPCVGEGAISDAIKRLPSVRRVDTNDIDKRRKADYHFDATQPYPFAQDFDWMVTNPPFSKAMEILQTAWEYVFPNIAMLARLSFLEPTEERGDWLQQNPPQQIIVLPRYSFRLNDEGKKATDSMTCCWLVWHREEPHPRRTVICTKQRAIVEALLREVPNAASPV